MFILLQGSIKETKKFAAKSLYEKCGSFHGCEKNSPDNVPDSNLSYVDMNAAYIKNSRLYYVYINNLRDAAVSDLEKWQQTRNL